MMLKLFVALTLVAVAQTVRPGDVRVDDELFQEWLAIPDCGRFDEWLALAGEYDPRAMEAIEIVDAEMRVEGIDMTGSYTSGDDEDLAAYLNEVEVAEQESDDGNLAALLQAAELDPASDAEVSAAQAGASAFSVCFLGKYFLMTHVLKRLGPFSCFLQELDDVYTAEDQTIPDGEGAPPARRQRRCRRCRKTTHTIRTCPENEGATLNFSLRSKNGVTF